jgi:hypothetical protein
VLEDNLKRKEKMMIEETSPRKGVLTDTPSWVQMVSLPLNKRLNASLL